MVSFAYFFPFFFIGMWVLVCFIISKMGWADLFTNYPAPADFIGTRIGIISAVLITLIIIIVLF
ncbi:hypothetical protein [Ferruginibacter albus]|uniref:hypothetical protein n=1 Tax=Ferruginibacter albus TaxID=2875540 RepID=UPI001CC35E4E|nr:hypothetical protein [Ferruginibacter albus]UAY53632.1 hypothetical protein K9M53_08180 [Ferruginibacter albus]